MMTQYEKVKKYLIEGIQSKLWSVGDRLPSENELSNTCQVSRMTARRAIKELEADGVVHSVHGKGTFITSAKHQSSAIELRNIADEIRAGNNQYSCNVLQHEIRKCAELAQQLGIEQDALFYSSVIHYENGLPIQLEKRYVNPLYVPDYLAVDLSQMTANEYLTRECPAQEVKHQIEAVSSTAELRDLLQLTDEEPCLRVTRTTLYHSQVVSHAILYHPGTRYVLGTRFTVNS